MKSTLKNIFLCVLLSVIFSCSTNNETISYRSGSLDGAFKEAKEQNKQLLVLTVFNDTVAKSDGFINKLESDKDIVAELKTNYLVYKCELPTKDDFKYKWFLSTIPKPTGYIFSPEGTLLDFVVTESHPSIILLSLALKGTIESKNVNNIHVSSVVNYYNEILNAIHLIEKNKNSKALEALYSNWSASKPNYFYFNYLMSKMATVLNKDEDAKLYAKRGVLYAGDYSQLLFGDLLTELKGINDIEETNSSTSGINNTTYKTDGVTLITGKVFHVNCKELTLINSLDSKYQSLIKIPVKKDGTFSYKLEDPDLVEYYLKLETESQISAGLPIPFIPDSDKITFTIFSLDDFTKNEIKGSEMSKQRLEFEKEYKRKYEPRFKFYNKPLDSLSKIGQYDSELTRKLIKHLEEIGKDGLFERLKYIEEDMTVMGYSMLKQHIPVINYELSNMDDIVIKINEVYLLYKAKFPNHPYTKNFDKMFVEMSLEVSK